MASYAIFLFLLAFAAQIAKIEAACNATTSSKWPVDCSMRAYLITPDANNQTVLTTTIYNTVYNNNTSNTTAWTSARKTSFNTYYNSIRSAIWDTTTYVTISSKLNRIVSLLVAYSSNNCAWQEYFYGTEIKMDGGCVWGSIGDFVACGNVSSNFSMPSTTVAPLCVVTVNASTASSLAPKASTTASSSSSSYASASTVSSSVTDVTITSSNNSLNSTCKIIKSSSWPVSCSQRGNLVTPDANNQTILTTIVYNTVYNVNTSNSSVWTSARKLSFNSYWNAMRNIIYNSGSQSSMSEKINDLGNLLVSYSNNDCDWQAQFFTTTITYGNDCTWGTIGDFLACGSIDSNYTVPTTTESPQCPYGGTISGGGSGGVVTSGGGGQVTGGFTEIVNISVVTGYVNISFSDEQSMNLSTATFPSINVSDVTANISLINATLSDLFNISSTVSADLPNSTFSTPTTECVTIAYYSSSVNGSTVTVPMSTSDYMSSTMPSFSSSPSSDFSSMSTDSMPPSSSTDSANSSSTSNGPPTSFDSTSSSPNSPSPSVTFVTVCGNQTVANVTMLP